MTHPVSDLEELRGGFRNRASAGLTVTVLPERSAVTDGEGWYGRIEVEDFELTLTPSRTRGSVGSITAEVTNDAAYMRIFSAPRARIANFAASAAEEEGSAAHPGYPLTLSLGLDLASSAGGINPFAAAETRLSAYGRSFGISPVPLVRPGVYYRETTPNLRTPVCSRSR